MPSIDRSQTIPAYIYEAYNTQSKRQKFPPSNFLLVDSNGNRKFPYRDPKSGAIHCGLLRAAMSRAAQYNYTEVETKARSIYEKSCKEKEKDIEIKKLDIQGEEVFGIVIAPDELDMDGDTFTKDAIRKACYEYNTYFQGTAYRHGLRLNTEQVNLLESYCVPTDLAINGETIKEGSWVQRWKIKDPELQRQIRDKEIVGFSLGGFIIDNPSRG